MPYRQTRFELFNSCHNVSFLELRSILQTIPELFITFSYRCCPADFGNVVSLAFAITAARLYPTVKYALGHGKACMRIVVGGTPLLFDHGRVPEPADLAVRTP